MTRKMVISKFLAAASLLFLLALLLILPVQAEGDMVYARIGRRCDLFSCWPVYGWVRRHGYGYYGDDGAHCSGNVTHATSTLHDTEQGALNSAKVNWGALVRAEMGERFMDIEQAADIRSRCYRASTNESLAGKAAEQLLGAFQWRCELKARACRAGWQYERQVRRR